MKLSLQQISTPNILETFSDISNISGPCTLELSDGSVTIPIRHAIVHLIFWRNFHAFGVPIRKDHIVFTEGICSDDTISQFQSIAYRELRNLYPDRENEINMRIFKTIDEYNQFILLKLSEWHSSIDIFQLSRLINDPKIKKVTEVPITRDMGTDVIEKVVADANKEFCTLIGTRGAIKDNVLLPFMESNLLNKNQLMQMFIALGVRTDINDMIVLYPITSSVMRGMQDICQYVVEALASKKSHFYNYVAVRDSQYFSRKQHLLTSIIRYIYPGNCGIDVTVPYKVTTQNAKYLIGKYIKNADGTETLLMDDNIPNYIDQTIHMFSPGTCRYTDGYCEHCGGLMSKYLPKELNVGILSATIVVKDITQLILSSKHFVKTNSIIYKVPMEGAPYFQRKNNEIFWRKDMQKDLNDLTVGFLLRDVCPIHDLTLLKQDEEINEEKFSHPTYMVITAKGRDDIEIPLVSDKTTPHLSAEFLFHMKKNLKKIKHDETMIWIPLKDIHPQYPIFRSVVANNSMMAYMKLAASFLQTNIDKMTSYSQALKEFTDIIYSKVGVNILHIETMLKAYMVTSALNYDVPVVTDPENVLFQTNPRIVKNRTVSGELAFQCLLQYLSYPGTFIIPRSPGVFDPFFAI